MSDERTEPPEFSRPTDYAPDDAAFVAPVSGEDALILDLDGFEGPLDALLTLARNQKVDLTKISILQLAEQYLAFIARARELKIEIAADYLVMAAWLAYMKSRLLLPEPASDEEPSGEEMAAALAFRLRRLEAMREASAQLMRRPRLGVDVFPMGAPDGVDVIQTLTFGASLFDLLKSYASFQARVRVDRLVIEEPDLYSVEEAYRRLTGLLGTMPDWESLARFLPRGSAVGLRRRSAVATTLVASLELAREGKVQLRQVEPFGPIYIRRNLEAP